MTTETQDRAQLHRKARPFRLVPMLALLTSALTLGLPLGHTQVAMATRQPLWASTYDGPAENDRATAIAASPDGTRVYVTGVSAQDNFTNDDYATIAYDELTGAQVWAQRYDGPVSADDESTSIAVSPDGTKVFVTGRSYAGYPGSLDDYATIAYDAATGAEIWVKRYEGLQVGYDDANSIVADPNGSAVYVTGASDGDFATIAYEAQTGNEIWVARYGPGAIANAAAVNPDGTLVFVTGSISAANLTDYGTIAYDASTGDQLWVQSYDGIGTSQDISKDVRVSPDGTKVFVTGQSYGGNGPFGGLFDYATVAYDAARGDMLWVARYAGPAGYDDIADELAISPEGTALYVTGKSSEGQDSFGLDTWDYATVAYDAVTGQKNWVRRYDNQSDVATGLALSPDGARVYVGGYSNSDDPYGTSETATVVYTAETGNRLSLRRFRGSGYSKVRALALNPEGTVLFVTGDTSSPADYLTIAYRLPRGSLGA